MREFCNCVSGAPRGRATPRYREQGREGRGEGSFSTADSRGPRKTIPRVRVKTKSRRVGFERFLLDASTNKPCTRTHVYRFYDGGSGNFAAPESPLFSMMEFQRQFSGVYICIYVYIYMYVQWIDMERGTDGRDRARLTKNRYLFR